MSACSSEPAPEPAPTSSSTPAEASPAERARPDDTERERTDPDPPTRERLPLTQLAVHERGGCVSDGATLWCWGSVAGPSPHVDEYGELRRARRIDLGQGDARLLAVDVWGRRACAAFDDQTLRCLEPEQTQASVTPIPAGVRRLAIASGAREDDRCVLADALVCLETPSQPRADVVDVDLTWTLGCAALDNGDVSCWKKGLAPSTTPAAYAGPLAPGVDAVEVAIDGGVCFRDREGRVWCTPFELLGPNLLRRPSYARVMPDHLGVEIAVGSAHVCLRDDEGQVFCAGANGHAQLGAGHSDPTEATTRVSLPGRATALAAAGGVTCAIVGGESVWCWGTDDLALEPPPSRGLLELDAIALHLAGERSCATLADGSLRCWGSDNPLHAHARGGIVAASEARPTRAAVTPIDAYAPYLILSRGTVIAGETIDHLREPDDFELAWRRTGVARMAGNGSESCTIAAAGGTLECWIDDTGYAKLTRIASTPRLDGASEVAVGLFDACAIVRGQVRCHHFVDEDLAGQWTPIPGLSDAVAIAVTRDGGGCALRSNGAVACWVEADPGDDLYSLAPSGVFEIAEAGRDTDAQIVEIAGGEFGVCLRDGGGSIRCGLGPLTNPAVVPADRALRVEIPTGAVELAAGVGHWCARTRSEASPDADALTDATPRSDRIECRGDPRRGQLGRLGPHVMLEPAPITLLR